MSNKDISMRSFVFLIIGVLLVLSLVICIYVFNKEDDLQSVDANVVGVVKDKDGTGKNDVTVQYEVDAKNYQYNFYYKDDVNVDDVIKVYYHKDNVTSVQVRKTNKLIFLFPLFGLILCVYGISLLFRKTKDEVESTDANYETKLLGEDEKTQQLKIITDDSINNYQMTPEELEEVPVKEIKSDTMVLDDLVIEEVVDYTINKKKTIIKPRFVYMSGETLVCEDKKNELIAEINMKDVLDIVKEIDKDKVENIIVFSRDYECHLSKVKDIDLEEFMHLLHNKMLVVKEDFNEIDSEI